MTHQIAIIGLGYVGLPLARLFATKFPVVGFDINQKRIEELNEGILVQTKIKPLRHLHTLILMQSLEILLPAITIGLHM